MTDKRISDAIEAVINENTFAPAALKAMQAELDKVRSLESEVERSHQVADSRKRDCDEAVRARDAAITRAEKAEEAAKKLAEADVRVARAEARAETYAKCFELVFRNSQVHRSVTSSVPIYEQVVGGGGFTSAYQSSESVVEETK